MSRRTDTRCAQKIDWNQVKNWNRSNLEIAMSLGCSKNAVQAERKRRGLPAVKDKHSLGGLYRKPARKQRAALYLTREREIDPSPIGFEEFGIDS